MSFLYTCLLWYLMTNHEYKVCVFVKYLVKIKYSKIMFLNEPTKKWWVGHDFFVVAQVILNYSFWISKFLAVLLKKLDIVAQQ